MKSIYKYVIAYLLFSVTSALAQNSLIIPDASGDTGDTISVSLQIDNSDSFVAFQTDILLPSQVNYLAGSAQVSSRAGDPALSAEIITGHTLRIVVYSTSQSTFTGSSGEVLSFQLILNNDPGTYTLSLSNVFISAASSQNILTSAQNGAVTIYGPDISVSADSLDFDRTPLSQVTDRNINLSNPGNTSLNISRIYTDNPFFKIIGDTSLTLLAGNNISVLIRFNSQEKGVFNATLFVQSNDPDDPLVQFALSAIAFAVNELHTLNASGRSGHQVDVSFSINNMEPFTGFQFDLVLDSVLEYIQDEVALSARKTDHLTSANKISANRLRVVVWSPGNQPFTGSAGEIVTVGFLLAGLGGNYPVNIENVIISDAAGDNITSDFFPGAVTIVSPDISGELNISFDETSVLSTAATNYTLTNQGSDTLVIHSFASPQARFWNSTTLPQTIAPGTGRTFELRFHSDSKGAFTDRFTVLSNDPDENPFYIQVSATAYSPNSISIRDASAVLNDTVTVKIDVDNYDAFVAFQADFEIPANLTLVSGSARLTNRKEDHSLTAVLISEHVIRLFAFSMSQSPFSGNSGAVVELDFLTGSSAGSFDLVISNAVLADAASHNILRDTQNGRLTVDNPTTIEPADGEQPENFALEQNYPNPFNPSTQIRFSLPKSTQVNLAVYDITGKKVAELISGFYNSGLYDLVFDGSRLPSGLYYYVLQAGTFRNVKRMILLK